jgi:hypothetical protein
VLFATTTFAVTAWFARATFSTQTSRTRDFIKNVFRVDVTDTLTILALLSGILNFLLGFVVDNVLDFIQWALICRRNGVEALSVLAVSATTGAIGNLGLLVDNLTPRSARSWATGKLLLRVAVWVSAIALFINTSIRTVYRPEVIYTATAGVGPFNGSLVQPYLDDLNLRNANLTDTTIPYSVSALAHNLIVNPQHSYSSPHKGCRVEDTCDSYILLGGMATASIATDNGMPPTDHESLPAMTMNNVPATRIDFRRTIAANDTTLTFDDCALFDQDPYTIAIRFCLAPSRTEEGAVIAAIYVCDLGTNHTTGECLSNHTLYGDGPPSINTTFSVTRLTTDLVVSRANFSVLQLSPSTDPIADHSLISTNDLAAYRFAIHWLLNNTAAGIPAPSSIIEYFWSAPLQITSPEYWSPGPRVAFESLLAYPLWFWQGNNVGNSALRFIDGHQYEADGMTAAEGMVEALREVLGNEYVTEAGLSGPAVRITVDEGMFATFCILIGAVLAVAWGVVLLLWFWKTAARSGGLGTRFSGNGNGKGSKAGVKVPKISSYPVVEIAMRTRGVCGGSTSGLVLPDVVDAGDSEVRRALRGKRLVFDGVIEEAKPMRKVWQRKKKTAKP